MPVPSDPLVILASDDLLFPSRVREAIRDLPYRLQISATESAARQAATEAAGETVPAALLVNLSVRRFDSLALIRALKSDPITHNLPLLAFAGHVEREKHNAARAAGADMIAANSSVSLHLPTLLTRLFSESPVIDSEDESVLAGS